MASLTAGEIATIRRTWAPVVADPEGNGAIILKEFLDKHNYYHIFKRFKDHPRETIKENAVFRNHASKIIKNLDVAVKNLDKTDVLVAHLKKLGESHGKRKITKVQFEEFRHDVLEILVRLFKINEDARKAWVKTFDIAFPVIYSGLEKTS